MNLRKLFGTDGIRGEANAFPMTGDIAFRVGQAVAWILQNRTAIQGKTSLAVGLKPLESSLALRRARIVIGKDTRLSGYLFEQAVSSGALSMGADVTLIGPLPTPGVAFVCRSVRADAGIMISASHNAYRDNGIKIFGADGFKWPDELEAEIERIVLGDGFNSHAMPTGDLIGKAQRLEDVHYRYVENVKSMFPSDMDLLGMRLVVDCANGAAYKAAPLVFEELGAEVFKTGVHPSGVNINHQCGALHPDNLSFHVSKHRAQFGVALDGDGDRCLLCDENGEALDGDQILGLCAWDMVNRKALKTPIVVTTPMTNVGLEHFLKSIGIQMIRAPVGDRHVVEKMRETGAQLGGEQSGHLIFFEHGTTGDGLVAALRTLAVMKRTQRPLSDLKNMISLFPQAKMDLKVSKRVALESLPDYLALVEKCNKSLKDNGRAFVRYSGTEPKLRILVEATTADEANHWAGQFKQVLEKCLL